MTRQDPRPDDVALLERPGLSLDDALGLLAAVQQLSRLRRLDDIRPLVIDTARRLTGADGVTFIVNEGAEVHYADEQAISPLWKGRRFPVDSCISGWAIQHSAAVVVEDVFADQRIPHDVYRPTFVKSLAMVPIGESRPVAAVGAYWSRTYRANPRDLQILGALADAASAALERTDAFARESLARTTAEDGSESRRKLLAVAAHDLRNPLTTILLSVIRLKEVPLENGKGERVRLLSDAIRRSALRMEALIHTLLEFVPLDGGTLTLATERCDVGGLLEAVEDLGPLALERNQTLEVQRATRSLPSVACDPGKIAQVFSNLVGNAIRHTPEGTTIRVQAARAENHVRFTVEDDGPGIAPDQREQLFEPFKKSDRSGRDGLGLGMTIARGLVEQHGGRLWLDDSRPGTVVHFTVPVASTE